MTPLGLSLILNAHLRPGQTVTNRAESVVEEINAFLDLGLMAGSLDALRLTKIGTAWLTDLLDTPLPTEEGPSRPSAWETMRAEERARQQQSEAAGNPPTIASIAAMREAYLASLPPLPDGFDKWAGETINKPVDIKGDDWVEVIFRDGIINKMNPSKQMRPSAGAAISFNWKHRDSGDDIIGYRLAPEPEAMHKMNMKAGR